MISVLSVGSLAKVFEDAVYNEVSCGVTMLKNQRAAVQFAVKSDADGEFPVEISSRLKKYITAFQVKCTPSELPAYDDSDDYFLRKTPGLYPDLLMPCDGSIVCKKDCCTAVWLEIDVPADAKAGNYKIEITVGDGSAKTSVSIKDCVLDSQELVCTHWFHSDCLSTYYGVEVFSEEYWRIVENYVRTAVKHGVNMILTPLFTPPLDTKVGGERPTVQLVDVEKHGDSYTFGFDKLGRWIDMCERCGVQRYEMSHLFTQWGAEHAPKIMAKTYHGYRRIFGWETKAGRKPYRNFISQLAPELLKYIGEKGIADRCYFHVSDEPSLSHLISYKKAFSIFDDNFRGCRHIDALGNYEFYKLGYVEVPVPHENNLDAFEGNVPELWTYFCCGQHRENVPNRFFAMPSLRNRILGMIMYRYGVKGFLQWGYNFWYTQYSVRPVDPFKESEAGRAFPSGDAYVVYPAPDGTPYCSLRFKVFSDGIQDYTALCQLEKKIGREKVIEIIEEGLDCRITTKNYPHDEKRLFDVMDKVYSMLEQ